MVELISVSVMSAPVPEPEVLVIPVTAALVQAKVAVVLLLKAV